MEVYHALADGTGALQFLRALVCRYLALRHREELGETPPQPDYDASETEQMADSFQKYYDKKKGKKAPLKFAYKLKGPKLPEYRIKVIEGVIPVPEVLKLAHSFQTTVTVLFTSLLLCAIHEGMSRREEKKPVVISVPVNLRNYFASESARNFFALMAISYDFSRQPAELEQVIPEVARAFRENLTLEKLKQHMNSLIAIEKNVAARAVPMLDRLSFRRSMPPISACSMCLPVRINCRSACVLIGRIWWSALQILFPAQIFRNIFSVGWPLMGCR